MGSDSENIIIYVENRTTLEIMFAEEVGRAIREEFATKMKIRKILIVISLDAFSQTHSASIRKSNPRQKML